MLAQAQQDPRSTYSKRLGLDRSGLLVAQYSYRDSETDSAPESPGSPHRLLNLLKDTNEDSLVQGTSQLLAPQTENVSVNAKKKGKVSLDVFKKKIDPHQESCEESTRAEGFQQRLHERSPTECKLKSKAVLEGNRPTTKDCGQSPINRRITSSALEVVDLGNILIIEEAPKKEPLTKHPDQGISSNQNHHIDASVQSLAYQKPTSESTDLKLAVVENASLRAPNRSRSELSKRDNGSSRNSFAPAHKRDKSLQGVCKTSGRTSRVQPSASPSSQTSTVVGLSLSCVCLIAHLQQ